MSDSEKGKGAGNLLVAQFLLGLLIYIVYSIYPTQPKPALVAIYLLLLGILFFSWKGLKGLWK
ncbi:MAG: hypothetical protein WAO55_06395 [Candidatus Manganitrophaceae bacterium]